MKWVLFTSGCVVALVALGFLAVDERDVVWEGRKPLCGYCRAELAHHAVVCRECNRSLDWRPTTEECRWCLERKDLDHLLRIYRELEKEEPLPAPLAPYEAYFEAIDVGACTYCGGIGMVMENGEQAACPVCRGDKRCVACAGTRSVVIGDDGAHRRASEREDERVRAKVRGVVTDLPLNDGVLVDKDVEALRGYVEAEDLTDLHGRRILDLARERMKAAFRTLHEEHTKRAKAPGGS
ncbi:MAG: hypothetical protein L6Q95_18115 [Planctomycetes bacterium]|nr:hypothetical protein [Planctomycetota bacterium]